MCYEDKTREGLDLIFYCNPTIYIQQLVRMLRVRTVQIQSGRLTTSGKESNHNTKDIRHIVRKFGKVQFP
jgi:hypothetical protein